MWPWTNPNDLETRVRKLETEVQAMKIEWTDVVDKLLHRLGRQAKRDRDALAAQDGSGGAIAPQPASTVDKKADLYRRAGFVRRMDAVRR